MKKEESFLDFIIKNKYVIVSLIIALIIISTGFLSVLVNVAVAVIVIMLAIYVGTKMQEDKDFLKKLFSIKNDDDK